MKKKHPFLCEICNSECMIYKKGKSHRVLVCPRCGVLATNGKLGKIAKRGLKAVVGEIPGASLVMEGLGLVGDLSKKDKPKQEATAKTPIVRDERGKYNYKEFLFKEALK